MKLRTLLEMKSPIKVGNQPIEGQNFLGIPIAYQDAKSIAWPKGRPRSGQKISLMIDGRARWVEIVSYHNMGGTFDLDDIEHGFKIQIERDNSPEKYITRVDAYLVEI
jgi:hypothetical protein